MPPAAILDIDGTLVDTNYQHAMSWYLAFRQHGVVRPIWRMISRYAELADAKPALDASTTYGMLDGLFCQTLLAWATGPAATREEALAVLTARVDSLLPSLLA